MNDDEASSGPGRPVESDSTDPLGALAELAAAEMNGPDRHFVDRLDARLRVAHASRTSARFPSVRRAAILATVAVAMLGLATVGLLWQDRGVSSALELSNARLVVVTLPDGSTVSDPADGFELPDGAVVSIGVGGSATIDGVALDEGVIVTVVDGSLVSDVVVATTVAPDVDRRDGPAIDDPETDRPALDVDRRDDPATDRPATDVDRPVEPEPVKPPVEPARTEDQAPATSNEPSVAPSVESPRDKLGVELGLQVRVADRSRRVRVLWSSGPDVDPVWRTVLVRSTAGIEPDWPPSDGVTGIGEFLGAGRGEIIDEIRPDVDAVHYRVVLVDSSGGAIARGAVQTIALG